jgi:hypothetical protein
MNDQYGYNEPLKWMPANPAPGDLRVEAVEKIIFRKFAVNKIKHLGVRKKPNSVFFYKVVSPNNN